MESKKGKQKTDLPRVTYDAATRTFDRLFKEDSLDDMKAVVRKKLSLSPSFPVYLSQWRDGKSVDLEDDDDFEAFSASARATLAVKVKVVLGAHHPPPVTAETTTETTEIASSGVKRKRKKIPKRKTRTLSGALDESSGTNSTPETEEAHRSKRQRVSFAEENTSTITGPSEGRHEKNNRTKLLSGGSLVRKVLNTDTESEQPQTEGSAVKKKKESKKQNIDEETEKRHRDKSDSYGSSNALDSKQKSNKRPRADSYSTSNSFNSATPASETMAIPVDLNERERATKKSKKRITDSMSGEDALPSTSQPLTPSIESPHADATAPGHVQVSKKKKSSSSIKEPAQSGAVTNDPTVEVMQDDPSSKKAQKAADSVTKQRSSSKPISKSTPVIEKPKSMTSSIVPHTSIAAAAAVPDKGSSMKKQKQKVDSNGAEVSKDKPEGTLSGSTETLVPGEGKALPSILGAEKSKKGKGKAAPESDNPVSDETVKQKKGHVEAAPQLSGAQGRSRSQGTTPSQALDMKEVTRKIVADIMKKAAMKNNASRSIQPANQLKQPERLEHDRSDQSNTTTVEDHDVSSVKLSQPSALDSSKPQKPVDKSVNPSPLKPVETSICPICSGSPSHVRSKCPIIKAGIKSMRNKIADLEKEESTEGAESRSSIILELQGIIEKKTKKPRVSEASKSFPDQPPVNNEVIETGVGSTSFSAENPKSKPPTDKAVTQPVPEVPSIQNSSSNPATSSRTPKPPVSVINPKSPPVQSNPVQSPLDRSTSQLLPLHEPHEPSESNKVSNNSKNATKLFPLLDKMTKSLLPSELHGLGDVSSFTDQDLDALVRGPKLSLKNIVPQSDSESEDESEPEEDVVLEDDQLEDIKSQRNLSRSGYPSSSDENEEEDDDEPVPPSPLNHSAEPAIDETENEGRDLSFLEVNELGSSVELDKSGNLAANAAVAADLVTLDFTGASEGTGKDDDSGEKSDSPDSDVPSPVNIPAPSTSTKKIDVTDPIEPSDTSPASQPEPIASDEEAVPVKSTPRSEIIVRTRGQKNALAKKADYKTTGNSAPQSSIHDAEEPEVEEVSKPTRRTRSLMKITELPVPPNPSVRVIRPAPVPNPRTRRQIALENEKEKEATPEPELTTKTRRATGASKTKTPAKPPSKAAKATTVKPLSKQNVTVTSTADGEKATNKADDTPATQTTPSSVQLTPPEKENNVSSWAVLQENQPSQTEPETLGMVDELLSSPRVVPDASPDQSGKGQKPVSTNGSQPDPLFIPAESQQSFPYSQFPDVIPPKEQANASAHDSEDEEEVAAAITKPVKASSQTYRSLRELSRQSGRLFQPRRSQIMNIVREPQVEDLYGQNGQPSEDSDSGTDSDAEDKPVSHIPASRRAGGPARK